MTRSRASLVAPADPGAVEQYGNRLRTVRRVALVIDELRAGGGERVVAHLAAGLPELGVRTIVICLRKKGLLAEQLEAAGVAVRSIGSTKGFDVGALLALGRELRRFQPDVINVHDRSSMPYVVLARYLGCPCPVVFTCHGLLYNAASEPKLRYRLALRAAAGIVAVSEEVAERHAAEYGLSASADIIPNGVPHHARSREQRQAVRWELGIPEEVFVFLSVGNARPEKGFEDLLEAAAALDTRRPPRPFVCLVAGRMQNAQYCAGLLERQRALNLEQQVRFLGFRSDTPALYSAADAFVLSSRSEGLPLVVLEAMMAGLPVIATRVGGVPDAVPSDGGLLVDAAEPAQLGHAMERLLADSSLCEALGKQGQSHAAAQYGVEQMVARYVQAYERAVSPRTATPQPATGAPR